MSDMRELAEQRANTSSFAVKSLKVFGWVLIVLGILLTITLIGAILGVPLIIMGAIVILMCNYLAKVEATAKRAADEKAEIHEYRLREAREASKKTVS